MANPLSFPRVIYTLSSLIVYILALSFLRNQLKNNMIHFFVLDRLPIRQMSFVHFLDTVFVDFCEKGKTRCFSHFLVLAVSCSI